METSWINDASDILSSLGLVSRSLSREAIVRMVKIVNDSSRDPENNRLSLDTSVENCVKLVSLLTEWKNLRFPFIDEDGSFGYVNGAISVLSDGYDQAAKVQWMFLRWNEDFVEYVRNCEYSDKKESPLFRARYQNFNVYLN